VKGYVNLVNSWNLAAPSFSIAGPELLVQASLSCLTSTLSKTIAFNMALQALLLLPTYQLMTSIDQLENTFHIPKHS